jgi:predicted amidohydrolase
MRVSVLQMSLGADKDANIAQAAHLLDDTAADLVTPQEAWICLGGEVATKLAHSEPLPAPGSSQPGGPAHERLRGATRIDPAAAASIRRGMPVLDHRRLA